MKATEILVCVGCMVLALSFMLGEASPAWRPQGRFGKRTRVEALPRVIETRPADEGITTLLEVPVELLFTPTDLSQMKRKPWLCTTTGIAGYPSCGGMVKRTSSSSSPASSRMDNLKTLAEYLNL